MKRCFFLLLVISGLTGAVFAQGGDDPLAEIYVEGEYVAIPLAEDLITLDGDLADWENLPFYRVDYGTMPSTSADNAYFEFSVAADSEFFYMAATTPDSTLASGPAGENWRGDSFELYINLTDDVLTFEYAVSIFQARIGVNNIGLETATDIDVEGSYYEAGTLSGYAFETGDGWGVEIAMPWAIYEYEPEDGAEIGFNVDLNGADVEGARNVKLIWSYWDTEDTSWLDPSVFGSGIFVEYEAPED